MTLYALATISSYSICGALIIGIARFKRMLKAYRPFFYLMVLACCNELLSDIIIVGLKKSNSVTNNIYVLLEYYIIVWFFLRLDGAAKKTKYYALYIFGTITWVVDDIVFHEVTETSSYFRVIYSVIVVFLSVQKLNEVLFNEVRQSLKNAALLACICFIVSYSFSAILEIFWATKLNAGDQFIIVVYSIILSLNLVINLLYSLVMLWVPTKQPFTLPY